MHVDTIGTVLGTRVDPASDTFARNRDRNLELVEQIGDLLDEARAGGGEAKVARHRDRGKLLLRERVQLLLDPGSPWLELQPLIGWGSDFQVGGSSVSGIGVVSGVECLIGGADPTVKGGAMNPFSVTKSLRSLQVARENRLPTINLTESAGAYVPGMSDYTILIRDRSKVFLGGPPLVKMATGEDATEEDLGGAVMHATVSGLGDYLAEDERDGIRLARQVIRHLGWTKQGPGPTEPADPPVHDPEECWGSPRSTCANRSTSARCWRVCSTGPGSTSSRVPTAPT